MTVDDVKRRLLRAMDAASAKHGAENELTLLRAAVEALPDRRLMSRLAPEMRLPIEEALSKVDEP